MGEEERKMGLSALKPSSEPRLLRFVQFVGSFERFHCNKAYTYAEFRGPTGRSPPLKKEQPAKTRKEKLMDSLTSQALMMTHHLRRSPGLTARHPWQRLWGRYSSTQTEKTSIQWREGLQTSSSKPSLLLHPLLPKLPHQTSFGSIEATDTTTGYCSCQQTRSSPSLPRCASFTPGRVWLVH